MDHDTRVEITIIDVRRPKSYGFSIHHDGVEVASERGYGDRMAARDAATTTHMNIVARSGDSYELPRWRSEVER